MPTALLVIVVGVWFVLLRNVWLFNRLLKLSQDEICSIELTYGQMMLRFWVWNVRKFLPRTDGSTARTRGGV